MLLREHPLITYKGNRSWPPAWLWTAGYDSTHPQGEVGILKAVLRSHTEPNATCFLVMDHCGAEYVGTLSISDPAFCREIFELLLSNVGKTIQEIGDLDFGHTYEK